MKTDAPEGYTPAIQVTLSCTLSDVWGAPEAFEAGGEAAVRGLIAEDLGAFFDEAKLRCAMVYVCNVSADKLK